MLRSQRWHGLPPGKSTVTIRFIPALLVGLEWMRRNPLILHLAIILGANNAVFIGGVTILVLYPQEFMVLSANE